MFQSCNGLYADVSDTSITLFWDQPDEATPESIYRIRFDGPEAAKTDRTHVTFLDLEPDTSHDFSVCLSEEGEYGDYEPMLSGTFRTLPAKRAIDVTQAPYNAVGDGKTLNTAAIQRALDDCDANSRVVVPKGTFLTGALTMHSDSELTVLFGGTLQGSTDPADYEPRVRTRFEGVETECYRSLINVGRMDHDASYTTRNVTISGEGSILGGGPELMHATIDLERERIKDQLAAMADYIATCENENTIPGRVRGRLINVANAQNVTISGLTLGQAPSWNLQFIYSDTIVTHNCAFTSVGVWNGDGWDPDSSTNLWLFDSRFDTGDDMVAIKSGKNPEGNAVNRPTRHVRIFDCSATHGHGIAIGSEMSGGVEDVKVWDVDIAKSCYGFHIKGTPKRGGYVRNVTVRDCELAAITIHAVEYNDDGEPGPDQPVFENFRFERVKVLGRHWGEGDGEVHPTTAVLVRGFAKPGHEVRDVVLRDVTLGGVKDGSGLVEMAYARNVTMENVSSLATDTLPAGENPLQGR
ncbi:glycosyl hydrolase family 28 protein [Bifidobacterium vespertilionis]|uniref:Glycoside hydrolase family 28 protein n=1 Tax=Bifidobacterium vespertilionis TaxID=2562524 RepID=A0A5J5E5L5_9BIFI|nr:glycosyl hydrolase family 28 protein [Bifidobacterium vespertilionis]KAA8821378.1 glycoside hydrolase family 28 protein [Bifidobacterium vespertilionis]KAA8824323.1 glycoside hydrolase family 28 protein [Bifidobacterium vespertilionis]